MTSLRFSFCCHRKILSISSPPPALSSWTLDFRRIPHVHQLRGTQEGSRAFSGRIADLRVEVGMKLSFGWSRNYPRRLRRSFLVKVNAGGDPATSDETAPVENEAVGVGEEDPFGHFRAVISSLPPVVFVMKRNPGASFVIGFCIATAIFFIVGRLTAARKAMHDHPGSVADLVRRGQLKSDRRGISRPLKYEDPFNNPLVKVGKKNSTVEMCGKVYHLAPVTLTKEEQAIHKRRRSRAYQWKRPTMFLKEGDTIPPDVDPDTVRWIPANHPFATTASDIDEDLAQTNVYQRHGVPFRIQAEHEELQRKLEGLQKEETLDKVVMDHDLAKDSEGPFKFQAKSRDEDQGATFKSSKSDCSLGSSESYSPHKEVQNS